MTKNNKYHHGSLRVTLIETGLELVSEKGPSAFSLREVAKRAGVSTAAPYYRFKNKAELLEAMVARGWTMMRDCFRTSLSDDATPMENLAALGKEYITFAIQHTAYFRVMNRPDLFCTKDSQESSNIEQDAGMEVFEMLHNAVKACYPKIDPNQPFIKGKVLESWVKVHGFATLWIDGSLKHTSLAEIGFDEMIDILFGEPCNDFNLSNK